MGSNLMSALEQRGLAAARASHETRILRASAPATLRLGRAH